MAIKDVLLHLDSYPEPTPDGLVDQAIWWASHLQAALTILTYDIKIPVRSNRVAEYLIHLTDLARQEEAKAHSQGRALLDKARHAAEALGLPVTARIESAHLYDLAEQVMREARTHDLCILPLSGRFDDQQSVAREVVFGSGRPTLVLGERAVDERTTAAGRVVVAWDGGASAARALADSLPFLARAAELLVVTVAGDKPGVDASAADEVVAHLRLHGLDPKPRILAADGHSAGVVIERHIREIGADLLVMGAYGHSRLREFVLGGATEHMLIAPPTALLMAHA